MSTLTGGPGLVTNGLVLYLDAANPSSYISGSLNWNDLSRSQLSGSLINGPTFDSGSTSSIIFDGVNDYIFTQQITNYKSLCMWVFYTNTGPTAWRYLIDARPNMANGWFVPSIPSYGSDWKSTIYTNGYPNIINNFPINQWVHLYLEGVNSLYTSNFNFMSRYTNDEQAGGKISNISIYNRALTSDEVLQNYNAQKSRFGL
jgi:hypothetical protein